MEYRFYGWETANVTDGNGLTPREVYDLLRRVWQADTCAPRLRDGWSPENPTHGQCSVTAFLAQDLFGGKVYGIPRRDGSFHCFNEVEGIRFDLTSEQFMGEALDYDHCPEQHREIHFAKAEKKERYHLLRERLLGEYAVLLKHNGLNCCQAVLCAYANETELPQAKQIGAAYGVGMGCMQATCGALCAAETLLGVKIYAGRPILRNAKSLLGRFQEKCGATVCGDLKGRDTGVVLCECDDCVRNAVCALEEELAAILSAQAR